MFEGLKRVEAAEVSAGGHCCGFRHRRNKHRRDHLRRSTGAVAFVNIDEPTVSMAFMSTTALLQAGRHVRDIRHLRDRLFKEMETDEPEGGETDSPDSFKVSGRGNCTFPYLLRP